VSDILKSQPGASKPLNRVKQSPGIPVEQWAPPNEKHIRNILDRAMNRSADEQDSK
jgi:hypothetical protein